MKVLLVNPWEEDLFPIPSIGYLQAIIKRDRPDVSVQAMDLAQAKTAMDTEHFDIVAVSFHSFSVKHAMEIRDRFKGHLICGGHHPSALPKQMLHIGYNQVVIGEGEQAILDIIDGNRKRTIVSNSLIHPDSIPFPDYTGLGWSGSMGLPIISSRGCPFKCSFCASSNFWHRKWKARSPTDVWAEVDKIYKSGINKFMFEDDNFTTDRKRAIEICKLISDYKMTWQCASRADVLNDEELCRELYAAGCRTVWLGVESLSEASLARVNKNIDIEKVLTGIATAERHGLSTMSQFIIGLPGDTENDILETVKNIKRSKIKRRGCNTAWILPGTDIHEEALRRGFDNDTYLVSGAPYYTYEQSVSTLQRWSQLINSA